MFYTKRSKLRNLTWAVDDDQGKFNKLLCRRDVMASVRIHKEPRLPSSPTKKIKRSNERTLSRVARVTLVEMYHQVPGLMSVDLVNLEGEPAHCKVLVVSSLQLVWDNNTATVAEDSVGVALVFAAELLPGALGGDDGRRASITLSEVVVH